MAEVPVFKATKLPITRDLRGNTITVHNLPPQNTLRWTPNKKVIVVRAVRHGLISLGEILERYKMTETEFLLWENGLHEYGAQGVMVTQQQSLRKSKSTDNS